MSDARLARPLAGYCHHGKIVAWTVDATPEALAHWIGSHREVRTVTSTAEPLDWCLDCTYLGQEV